MHAQGFVEGRTRARNDFHSQGLANLKISYVPLCVLDSIVPSYHSPRLCVAPRSVSLLSSGNPPNSLFDPLPGFLTHLSDLLIYLFVLFEFTFGPVFFESSISPFGLRTKILELEYDDGMLRKDLAVSSGKIRKICRDS